MHQHKHPRGIYRRNPEYVQQQHLNIFWFVHIFRCSVFLARVIWSWKASVVHPAWHNGVPIIHKFITRGWNFSAKLPRCPLRWLSQSVTPSFDLTAVHEKRGSVNGGVSPSRAEIVRKIDRNRNQRLQRLATPPCAGASLQFVISENKPKRWRPAAHCAE